MVLGGAVALRRKGIPPGSTAPQVPLRGVRFRVWMSCSSSRLQVGSAGAEGGSDQSLKRSHGRVLWAIDALMCSGVDPSRFVARWFQSIAPNCMRCGQRASRDGARVGLPGDSGKRPGKRPSAPRHGVTAGIRPHPAAQGAAWHVPAGGAQKRLED
jgi:hypothetical protein